MTERRPNGLGWETWIDRQVREAEERGEFDDLPGHQPLALRPVSVPGEGKYAALGRLGELGREIERRRGPDPYPRPTGPPPRLEELRRRRNEVERVASGHGALTVWVFGSVARDEAGPGGDLDLLVDMGDRPSLVRQAALQGDLEQLVGCPVHIVTTGGLSQARAHTRTQIAQEALAL